MPTKCLVKQPYNSRTFKSSNVFHRSPVGNDKQSLQENLKAKAWESHRGTWGTAIYEHPVQRATHDDMTKLKNVLRAAKLPPCSLKGHRHFGALAEPVSLLEGNIDVAEKGASLNFKNLVYGEVMGSTAGKQRSLNQSWNNTETIMQLHTQACLEYVTSLQVPTGKSTMGSDYVEHNTAYLYQPLPSSAAATSSIRTPFAQQIKKQQLKYNSLIKSYYKELSSKAPSTEQGPTKRARSPTKTARCRSTTPISENVKIMQPRRRSRSAMLRNVSEATSTSEVSCSLAVLPASRQETSMTREQRLTAKITDAVANRQMNLKRSDLPVKSTVRKVPQVQYFLSETRATQTDGGLEQGLNPRWPPSSKSDHPDKIGYPHLRLPLAINTLIRLDPDTEGLTDKAVQVSEPNPPVLPTLEADKLPSIKKFPNVTSCMKSQAHKEFNKEHKSDWVPRIWDYNYLLFHLDRRDHHPDGNNLISCHGSRMSGLIG